MSDQELDDILQLITDRNYDQALEKIDEYIIANPARGYLLQAEIQGLHRGDYAKGTELLDRIFTGSEKHQSFRDILLEAKILQFRICNNSDRRNQIPGIIEEIENLRNQDQYSIAYKDEFNYLTHIVKYYRYLGDYEASLKVISQMQQLLEEKSGDLSEDTIDKSRTIIDYEEMNTYFHLGELRKSIRIGNNILERTDFGSYAIKGQLARMYFSLGDYTQAIAYTLDQYHDAKEVKDLRNICHGANYLGQYYLLVCEIDKANYYLSEANQLSEQLDLQEYMLEYTNGLYAKTIGDFEEAASHFENALTIVDPEQVANTSLYYTELIIIHLRLNNKNKAKEYLLRLKTIAEDYQTKYYDLFYRLSESLYLNELGDVESLAKSKQTLRSILDEEIIWFPGTFTALLYYIDILIQEQFLDREESRGEEIDQLLEKYQSKIGEENLISFQIELIILKSFWKIQGRDLDTAMNLLQSAFVKAEEAGFLNYGLKIMYLQETLMKKSFHTFRYSDFKQLFLNYISRPFLHGNRDADSTEALDRVNLAFDLFLFNPADDEIIGFSSTGQVLDQASEKFRKYREAIGNNLKSYFSTYGFTQRLLVDDKKLIITQMTARGWNVILTYIGNSFAAYQRITTITQLLEPQIRNENDILHSNSIITACSAIIRGLESKNNDAMENYNLTDEFGIMIHPIRFSILRLFQTYHQLSRIEIMNLLELSSGSLTRQLRMLEDEELLKSDYIFSKSENRALKFYFVTNKAITLYTEFRKHLAI